MEENYNQEYQSGQNAPQMVPPQIKKWNWGAFMYSIFWGIGNKTYLPLLCLIPLVNIVMVFICGAKGNEWAWKNNHYKDVETFMAVQETWNRAGFVTFIVWLAFAVLYILLIIAGVSLLGTNYYNNI